MLFNLSAESLNHLLDDCFKTFATFAHAALSGKEAWK